MIAASSASKPPPSGARAASAPPPKDPERKALTARPGLLCDGAGPLPARSSRHRTGSGRAAAPGTAAALGRCQNIGVIANGNLKQRLRAAVKRIVHGATLQRHLALGMYSPTSLALPWLRVTDRRGGDHREPRQGRRWRSSPPSRWRWSAPSGRRYRSYVAAMQRGVSDGRGARSRNNSRAAGVSPKAKSKPTSIASSAGSRRPGVDGLDRATRPSNGAAASNGHAAAANDNNGGDGVTPAQLSL